VQIALVPLDERPVNVEIPREVAEIAGARLVIPPAEALPSFRTPADLAQLHSWLTLTAEDPATSQLVVCVDTLVFGGIIPARITDDSIVSALARLDLLTTLHEKCRPDLAISAVSLVMRASDSYSAVEEPDYWSEYGRELHRFGGALHRALDADAGGSAAATVPEVGLPDAVRQDFELRRLRNHLVNLASVGLHESGVLETLAITADDTAPLSAGSAEQAWIRHWQRALPAGRSILSYPGADEVGAVLVARALVRDLGSPAVAVACGEADGLDRVPNFENVSLRESIARQIAAVGAHLARPGETPDIVLIAHAPDPERGDYFGSTPASDPVATRTTIEQVESWLAAGVPIALADVRFSNGSDPDLVDGLADRGLLMRLSSYAGWNTAGNTIGSAMAHAVARWAGERMGTVDSVAAERALLSRILEDRGYQSGLRSRIQRDLLADSIKPVSDELVRAATEEITSGLQDYLDRITPSGDSWRVSDVTLPWKRSFEIGFRLTLVDSGWPRGL
jgi:hypothetical protein